MELGILFKKNYSDFARKALETFASGNDKNVVFSPFSMFMLLAMLADATKGEARKEILNVIDHGIYKNLAEMFTEIRKTFAEEETLVSANAVYVKKSLENSIVPEFRDKLAKYEGELFTTENYVEEINAWVSEKTQEIIPEILDKPLDPLFAACFMNAVSFESLWDRKYCDEDIKEGNFKNADKSLSIVNMMKSSEEYYIEDDFYRGFVKLYNCLKYSFMALLPKKSNAEFLDYAMQQVDFVELFNKRERVWVRVVMPEFKCDCTSDLKKFCKNSGINTVFSPKADFSPFCKARTEIGDIIHKAHIEVDRKGTRAAALTYCGRKMSAPVGDRMIKPIHLDRPFIYAIVHNDTGLPVFVGTVKHIETKEVKEVKEENKETEEKPYFLFHKRHANDKIWWVTPRIPQDGPLYVSFDKKTILNLWSDYPWKFTKEQKELFDKENPYWADFFSYRSEEQK
ncbi:hypothetical protein J5690_01200 [bacterium]|nr:hypothetical protein [bacterium]